MDPRQRHCHLWSWFRDLSEKCFSGIFLEESINAYGMLAGTLLGLLALHPQSLPLWETHSIHSMDKGHTHIQCCRRQHDHVSPSRPLRDTNGVLRRPCMLGAEFFFKKRKKVPSHWICNCWLDSQPHAGFILPRCLKLLLCRQGSSSEVHMWRLANSIQRPQLALHLLSVLPWLFSLGICPVGLENCSYPCSGMFHM